ncbi:hypothetical protein FFI16_027455 [Pseudomonas sp. KBS0710]|nr:hypothetical protein FFI16_027455 [Pseudomonas sp. KBS0710]
MPAMQTPWSISDTEVILSQASQLPHLVSSLQQNPQHSPLNPHQSSDNVRLSIAAGMLGPQPHGRPL